MLRKAMLIVTVVGLPAVLGGCASSGGGGRSGGGVDFDDAVSKYLDTARIDLAEGKTDLINDVMNLSEAEAEVFWEIYQGYEDEYFALGERRAALERELAERAYRGTMDDPTAARLASDFLVLRGEMLDLLRRTHARLSAELSPRRAGQFLMIEHRMGTVVDLVVASELPLIRGR
ncbi:MAG TPA: hypothetical protein DEB06_02735 [Phycisphaerales bacterium]|nr:hypothetical protein [Phycisphaerales bacterium]